MEHKREDEAYIIFHRGARSRVYKRCERARARERESSPEVSCLSLPSPRLSHSACLCSPAFAAYVCASARPLCVPVSACLRKALDIPVYRYKEMAQLYNGGVAMC
jgi:hypothetical protein